MTKYFKAFKKDGNSFNGKMKTDLTPNTVIKAKGSIVNHNERIWFSENNIAEYIYNAVNDLSDIEIWEIEPLTKVYDGDSLNINVYSKTYKYAKSVKLISKIENVIWVKKVNEYTLFMNEKQNIIDQIKISAEYSDLEKEVNILYNIQKEYKSKWENGECTYNEFSKHFKSFRVKDEQLNNMVNNTINKLYEDIITIN